MTGSTQEGLLWAEWDAVLRPFYDNPKGVEPDIKALAIMLRSDKPLPRGIRLLLAEILGREPPDEKVRTKVIAHGDDEFSWVRAQNWRLMPVYCRGREKEERAAEKESRIAEAMAAERNNITNAIANLDSDGVMPTRTAWTAWRKMKARREWMKKWVDDRRKKRGH
jgi:hypothetical protein